MLSVFRGYISYWLLLARDIYWRSDSMIVNPERGGEGG